MDLFERQYSMLSINVCGYKNKKVFPLFITGDDNRQNHVNLFRLTDLTENAHYVLNKTVSRLIRPQYSNYGDNFLPILSAWLHIRKSATKGCRCLQGPQGLTNPTSRENDGKRQDKVRAETVLFSANTTYFEHTRLFGHLVSV